MSKEYSYSSAESPYEDSAYLERLPLIDSVSADADEKLEEIAREQLPYPYSGTTEEQFEWFVSKVRQMQLGVLSSFTLEMAEHEDYDAFFDLDDPRLLDGIISESDFFTEHQDIAREAIRLGEARGTEDFLEILSTVADQSAREFSFFPWRKDLLPHYQAISKNKLIELPYPTRLPNIEIVFSYPAGKYSLPRREMRLKK